MDNYIHNVSGVKSIGELTSLLCGIGLQYDDRKLYGKYQCYMNAPGRGGLWQDPEELATFLWEAKNIFKGMTSYLDIGTFNGFTTCVIVEFLKAHVNKDIRVKTVDPCNHIHPSVLEYVYPYYSQGTVDDIGDETYDIVFIDGDHSEPGPMHDFEKVKSFAKVVFFHDISDNYCPYVIKTFKELSKQYTSWGVTQNRFGIGYIILP